MKIFKGNGWKSVSQILNALPHFEIITMEYKERGIGIRKLVMRKWVPVSGFYAPDIWGVK